MLPPKSDVAPDVSAKKVRGSKEVDKQDGPLEGFAGMFDFAFKVRVSLFSARYWFY